MNTTNLFVELIVIGVGATIWVLLLIVSIFGYSWIPLDMVVSLPALIPVLSIIYVLGIVSDRFADALFEQLWKPRLHRQHFALAGQDFDDRRLIYLRADRLADLLEYGRSRIRICRGWAFNTVGIIITLNLFALTHLTTSPLQRPIIIFGTLFLVLFAWSLWFAWRQLVLTDYRKIRDQAAYLRKHSPHDGESAKNP